MFEIEQGTVTVAGVTFDWWTTEGKPPTITVSHPDYGKKSEPLGSFAAKLVARVLAKEVLTESSRQESR